MKHESLERAAHSVGVSGEFSLHRPRQPRHSLSAMTEVSSPNLAYRDGIQRRVIA